MKARFVLKWSADNSGNPRAKARLVLQGFSDPDLLRGELDTSSPTLSRSSRQILLAIATCKSWLIFISDVATAFLQGDPQKRILWARIPKDACQLIGVPAGTLMRLLKPIYGQADAPRRWFQVARRRLIAAGYQPHPLDQCLYCLFHGDQLVSMIGIHVDDLIGADLNPMKSTRRQNRLFMRVSTSNIGLKEKKLVNCSFAVVTLRLMETVAGGYANRRTSKRSNL